MSHESARFRIADHVTRTILDGTAILLDAKGGNYLGMNEVGTEILEVVAAGGDEEQVVRSLASRFVVEEALLQRDVRAFLAELERRGIVERVVERDGERPR